MGLYRFVVLVSYINLVPVQLETGDPEPASVISSNVSSIFYCLSRNTISFHDSGGIRLTEKQLL